MRSNPPSSLYKITDYDPLHSFIPILSLNQPTKRIRFCTRRHKHYPGTVATHTHTYITTATTFLIISFDPTSYPFDTTVARAR